jgi:hypothetical protein
VSISSASPSITNFYSGGGKEQDPEGGGKRVQVTSQLNSLFARAFLKSKDVVMPIGAIAGKLPFWHSIFSPS